MDRCLAIEEVVREIVRCFPHSLAPDDRRFFVGLACVSRVFYEPAMDLLWERLPGLGPLIRCLPEDAVKYEWGLPFSVRIIRSPVGDEWARFVRHARRVRAVFLQGSVMPGEARFATDLASLEIISAHLPQPIFPRLRYLKFTLEFLRFAHIFLHPRLESITVYGVGDMAHFALFLQKIPSIAPNLQMLHVMDDAYFDCPNVQLSDTTCALTKLESLDGWYSHLTRESLTCLSKRPHFRSLSLMVHQFNMRIWDLPSFGNFPSLTSLKLAFVSGMTPVEWTQFLHCLGSAPLERISIAVWAPQECPSGELAPFLDALGHFTRLSACEVTMMSDEAHSLWHDAYLDHTALRPLYRARGMRSLTLEQLPLSFAPPLLAELAEAWPRLQTLALQPHFDLYHDCLLPLADLLHLARRCPGLRAVDVEFAPVDDGWQWHAPGELESDVPPSTLESLKVQTTYIEPAAAPRVAAFLDRYFPNARLVGEVNADELVHCSVGYVSQLRTGSCR